MEKHEMYMVKYDEAGNPIGATHGIYKQKDIDIFRRGGYVNVEKGLAMRVSEELTLKLLEDPIQLPKA